MGFFKDDSEKFVKIEKENDAILEQFSFLKWPARE